MDEEEKATERWIKNLTDMLKPEEVIVAKAMIVGYAWDEKTKTLYFLSRKETKSYDKSGLEWVRFGDYPKVKGNRGREDRLSRKPHKLKIGGSNPPLCT